MNFGLSAAASQSSWHLVATTHIDKMAILGYDLLEEAGMICVLSAASYRDFSTQKFNALSEEKFWKYHCIEICLNSIVLDQHDRL
mmetsp:Transcript_46753/g.92006  ORF Transcript_46753/g.92006 Transcript_46753/m.92006 type:complete len:85 (-) Transcript_46753:36-290(-)